MNITNIWKLVQKHMKITAFFFIFFFSCITVLLFCCDRCTLFYCCIMFYLSFRSQANFYFCSLYRLHRIHQFIFESSAQWSLGYNVVAIHADALSYRQLFSRRHRSYFSTTLCCCDPPVSFVWHLRESARCVRVFRRLTACAQSCASMCVSVCVLNMCLCVN